MPTDTTNYGLLKPLVNDVTDQDLWGGYLNDDMDELDGLLLSAFNFIKSSQTADFSITVPTTGTSATGDSHKLFRCDATSGAIIPTLPAAADAGNGFTIAFKKTDSTAHAVTITVAGSDKIDGAATFALTAQYNWAILVSDGVSEWDILSDTVSTAGFATLAGDNAFVGANDFTGGSIIATTQAANDSSTKVATTEFANPANSIGTNGYQKFTSGLIIQWGTSGSISPTSSIVITYPITFPTAALNAQTTPVSGSPDDGILQLQATLTSTSQLTLANKDGDTTVLSSFWYAIGH